MPSPPLDRTNEAQRSVNPHTDNVLEVVPIVKLVILVRLRQHPFVHLGQGERRVRNGLQGALIPHRFQIEMLSLN